MLIFDDGAIAETQYFDRQQNGFVANFKFVSYTPDEEFAQEFIVNAISEKLESE